MKENNKQEYFLDIYSYNVLKKWIDVGKPNSGNTYAKLQILIRDEMSNLIDKENLVRKVE